MHESPISVRQMSFHWAWASAHRWFAASKTRLRRSSLTAPAGRNGNPRDNWRGRQSPATLLSGIIFQSCGDPVRSVILIHYESIYSVGGRAGGWLILLLAQGQGTAFTYQGRLSSLGVPANGLSTFPRITLSTYFFPARLI